MVKNRTIPTADNDTRVVKYILYQWFAEDEPKQVKRKKLGTYRWLLTCVGREIRSSITIYAGRFHVLEGLPDLPDLVIYWHSHL